MVFIDYIQLFDWEKARFHGCASALPELKRLSVSVPILFASQLGKTTKLSDLTEGDFISFALSSRLDRLNIGCINENIDFNDA